LLTLCCSPPNPTILVSSWFFNELKIIIIIFKAKIIILLFANGNQALKWTLLFETHDPFALMLRTS